MRRVLLRISLAAVGLVAIHGKMTVAEQQTAPAVAEQLQAYGWYPAVEPPSRKGGDLVHLTAYRSAVCHGVLFAGQAPPNGDLHHLLLLAVAPGERLLYLEGERLAPARPGALSYFRSKLAGTRQRTITALILTGDCRSKDLPWTMAE